MSLTESQSFIESLHLKRLKDEIDNIHRHKILEYYLLVINVKNYEQIRSLLSRDHLYQIDKIISDIITSTLRDNFTDFKIFTDKKYFFCLIKTNDDEIIENVAYKIHKLLLTSSFMSLFADSRFVGLRLTPEVSFDDYLNIISDQNYYNYESKIFFWLKDLKQITNNLVEDYQLLGILRNAINKSSACFAFQPIVSSHSGKIVYHECLLRLSNLHHELISAGRYIQLAEKYGYIPIIDEYVVEMAINELISSKDVRLSVNISNLGVQSDLLIKKLHHLLKKYNVGPRLIIEVTETAVNNDYELTKKFLNEAKECGCSIAIDDFGVGYTSFNQVRKLPVDIIKIDGSFVREINVNNKSRIFVENIIKTASDLNCKTVAEFVENGEIAKILIDLEVDFMQGNFFSPALNYRSWKKI